MMKSGYTVLWCYWKLAGFGISPRDILYFKLIKDIQRLIKVDTSGPGNVTIYQHLKVSI